jgi:RES domain-containing protein
LKTPPLTRLDIFNTHRLIPLRYAKQAEIQARVVPKTQLDIGARLAQATDPRLLAEHDAEPGISALELVTGVPYYGLINATFTHTTPSGSRFNDTTRGAWYAGFEIETSLAEIAHHASARLAEIGRFNTEMVYVDYLADFHAPFHDLRSLNRAARAPYLDPRDYRVSQHLAAQLLANSSAGIVYPSVRRKAGTCLACFRPPLVHNIRPDRSWRFTWSDSPAPTIQPAYSGRSCAPRRRGATF